MGQGDDGVVARCQRLLQAVVLEARHVALDEGLAGQNLIAPLGEDPGQLHRRAFADVVDIGLEAHAQHGHGAAGSDIPLDPVGHPGGLGVVDQPGLVDQGGDILELFVDKPGVHGDAVAADAHAGGVDVDPGMAVGQLDQGEDVDAQPVADLAQLVGIGDVDIPEGILHQLAHLGGQIVGDADGALGDHGGIDLLGVLRRFGPGRADDAVILPELDEHSSGDNPLRAVGGHKFLRGKTADLGDDGLHQPGGIGRRGGLQDAEVPRPQYAADAPGRRLDKAHIADALSLGRVPVGGLDADDKHIRRLGGRGEVEPAGGHGLGHGVLEAGLHDMNLSVVEPLHHGGVDVKAADRVARQRKGHGGGQADIAAAHNFNFLHAT